MVKRPTYEELKQKVKKLEKECLERKRTEEQLRDRHEKYKALIYRNGEPNAILVAAREITAQRKADKALRKSEAYYRALVEDMPALICRFLPDGTLSFVNSSYCRYFDKTREELVGQNFFQFIPEPERKKVRTHFESLTF